MRRELVALVPPGVKSVLDIGCGTGIVGQELRTTHGCRVTGIEIVSVIADAARSRLDSVISGAAERAIRQFPENSFDFLIMADSLEHLSSPVDFLRHVRRVLSASAGFLISIPNVAPWSVVRMLAQGHWNYEPGGIMDDTHLRWFSLRSIATLLESVGFQIEQVEAVISGGPGMPRRYLRACSALHMDMRFMEIESQCYQYRMLGRVMDTESHASNRYEDLVQHLAVGARAAYWRYELADGWQKWVWRNYAPGALLSLAKELKRTLSR
jgi:methionine biosynthesis protein MetW